MERESAEKGIQRARWRNREKAIIKGKGLNKSGVIPVQLTVGPL